MKPSWTKYPIQGAAGLARATRLLVAPLFVLLPMAAAMAGPWLNADDPRLRHDLQLLADSGLITVPLTAWPLPLDDIAQSLGRVDAGTLTNPSLKGAYQRVQDILNRESVRNKSEAHVRLAATNEPSPFRGFAELLRDEAEASAGVSWQGDTAFYRVNATAVTDPDDEEPLRGDGSYVGARWGNWLLSAAAVDRWWGPGWNGSLILSSNARPVPALVVQRNQSTAFETPLLSWMGPWQFIFMQGQLDGEATIPYALLTGMRFNFKPIPAIEIGVSRTAQWGGKGRPENFDTFWNMILGEDNLGSNGTTAEDEPGNQLGGFDIRWASPVGDLPYALYAQMIGEDQAEGFIVDWPHKFMGMAGLEIWHSGNADQGSGRLYIEFADTAVDFNKSEPLYNVAYEHHIYTSGYRYYGLCLGHSMCGDGRMTTVGYVRATGAGNSWDAVLRRVEPDRDATPSRTVHEAGFTYTLVDGPSRYVLGVGLDHESVSGEEDTVKGRLGLQWRRTF